MRISPRRSRSRTPRPLPCPTGASNRWMGGTAEEPGSPASSSSGTDGVASRGAGSGSGGALAGFAGVRFFAARPRPAAAFDFALLGGSGAAVERGRREGRAAPAKERPSPRTAPPAAAHPRASERPPAVAAPVSDHLMVTNSVRRRTPAARSTPPRRPNTCARPAPAVAPSQPTSPPPPGPGAAMSQYSDGRTASSTTARIDQRRARVGSPQPRKCRPHMNAGIARSGDRTPTPRSRLP